MNAAIASGFVLLALSALVIIGCLLSWVAGTDDDDAHAAERDAAYMAEVRRQP
jgi:hypothetical protein